MGCRSQMIRRAAIVMGLTILSIAVGASAQCPSGFLNLGEVSATTPSGRYQEVRVTREIAVPVGIQIDDSYHQLSIQAASDGGASDMRAGQIPAGFQLVPGGQGSGAWWSIDNPELKRVPAGTNDSDHWVFQIDLYANSGARSPGPGPQSESPRAPSVRVRVCVKTRS
jgi:hypothetical protein